jgi:hypothetical protein
MLRPWLSLLLIGAISSGCATTQNLAVADRQTLKSIGISSDVKKADTMYYSGPENWAPPLITLLRTSKPVGEDLELQALSNNIHIDQIVLEEVTAAFKSAGKVTVEADRERSANLLSISIVQHGFSVPNGFSSKLVPVMMIICSITDSTGRVIWKGSKMVLPLGNPAKAEKPEDLYQQPMLIERAWRSAARYAAENIAKQL